MKPITTILFCTCMAISISASAQETSDPRQGNNDLKINVLYGVLEALELEYERILNDNTGVGLAASYWFNEDSDLNFITIPYFRFYPSDKYHGSGFFIEGNLAVIGSTDYVDYYDGLYYSYEEENVVNMGAGVAVGGKFMSKSGFFGEVFGGVGRVFGESYIEVYPRAGITLGRRF